MTELIAKSKIEKIVKEHKITSETTPEELMEIIVDVVYKAINSINTNSITDGTFSNVIKGVKKKGGRL